MDGGETATDTGPALELTCEFYCSIVQQNCGFVGEGEYWQYGDTGRCTEVCSTFAEGSLEDTDVNTLGCRINRADQAASDQAAHCHATGLYGGNLCGTWCDNYCDQITAHCTDGDAQYADGDECMTACADLPVAEDRHPDHGDHVQCRIGNAIDAVDTKWRCKHAAAEGSEECVDD